MDPDPSQLSDQEQMMLGAQQAAILQQMQDTEMESKALQQQHMIEEEQLLEAQHEALAFHQHTLLEHEKQVEMPQQPPPTEGQGHIQHHIHPMAADQEIVHHPPHLTQQLPEAHGVMSVTVPAVIAPPPLMAQPHPQPVVFLASEPTLAPAPATVQPVQPQPTVSLPPPHLIQPMSNQGAIPVNAPTPLMSTPIQPLVVVNIPFSGQAPIAGPPPPLMAPIQNLPPPQRMTAVAHESLGPPPQRVGGSSPMEEMPPQRLPPPNLEDIPIQRPHPPQDMMPAQPKAKEPEHSGSDSPGPVSSQSGPPKPPPAPQQKEIKLPQALEKVLAYKGERAQQVGVKPEDVEKVEKGEIYDEEDTNFEAMLHERPEKMEDFEELSADDEFEEETTIQDSKSKKESKNKKRKKKKKRAKARKAAEPLKQPLTTIPEENYEIEYIQDDIFLDKTDSVNREFARIFEAFKITGTDGETGEQKDASDAAKEKIKPEDVPIKARGLIEDDDDDDDDLLQEDDDKPRMSKKKQKKLNRLSVAELKQLVLRPDVVEMHDVTARDPKLLVHLKATRNTVTVPRHWCFKRKYLQGKRGIEKPPFDLPEFIKATGIMEMRQALQEKEDQKTMKSKMRERVRPKMGKIDIDYQKLHDAFFKWQTKPKLSIHGDLYYEGKEFETRLKEKKPGNLTDELRTALGMPVGPNCDRYPPPWLIAMQRYGPPPSYPNLKIPGLNGPIPEGCSFGYHAGGWGKPPVDESGKPLYGDVFGTQTAEITAPVQEEEVDRSYWGELESESEEEESRSEDSDEETEMDGTGLITPGDAGLVTPSGVCSIPVGVETPDMIELRKKRIEDAMDQGGDTPALYQVLPEKKAAVGGAMMGSTHVYDVSAVTAGKKAPEQQVPTEGVEVALNPDELDLDSAAMKAKYEQTMREQQSQLEKEDLSDMVAEHAAKQQKKRKKQQQEGKSAKKYKEFKF